MEESIGYKRVNTSRFKTISNNECMLARLNRLQVMKELEISPSSSTSTITQDELPEEESIDITIPTIYGAYHTPKN